ncbi:LysM domain-containing protein [Colletotrichum gloeosporioides]|uniref:LysM domain-containing protein n=1 Tax=Colletotrichum gloeosporioides TaxID=474922 RepID=A0A8H4FRG5_COLGL|nr:LysM domain-containing protein [Colletotrichum gloeosporioides]KAF3811697.1 LysM domain-containing protein [Colletotrichum gloeosporioides]
MNRLGQFLALSYFVVTLVSGRATQLVRRAVPNLPFDPNTISTCTDWWDNEGFLPCVDLITAWNIDISDFRRWNPSITADCGNFQVGMSYCIGASAGPPPVSPTAPQQPSTSLRPSETSSSPPSTTTSPGNGVATPQPTQPGMVDNCNKFYFVKPGDTCQVVVSNAGISLEQFYAWNPSVGNTCSGLWADVNVCVGLIGQQGTPTTPSNGIKTPLPTQPGLVNNCYKFYLVKPGEICIDITAKTGVSLSQLNQWNPSIGSGCSGLWADVHICIGVFDKVPTHQPYGCFSEVSTRALSYAGLTGQTGMTVEFCAVYCMAEKGRQLFGVQFGGECWCGDSLTVGSVKVADGDCNMPCTGNAEQRCGGSERLHVYGRGGAAPLAYKYHGCYTEGTNTRALGIARLESASLTVAQCAQYCLAQTGTNHFAVEFGRECWCGNNLGTGAVSVPEAECNMPCAGNSGQTCGGSNRLNLYSKQLERPPMKFRYEGCFTELSTGGRALGGEQRLRSRRYIHADAVAAFEGKRLPHDLGRELTRLCVVHGIRFHADFCFGPAAVLRGSLPLFTRALNARAIMSNRVPDMNPDQPGDMPYCIWFPDLPSEDTLRELVRCVPAMAYQAARACAVAGHTELYKELSVQILPEVSIAEEARENGSHAIFNMIMEAPCRYKVFDDYNRTIDTTAPKPAFLNGDTAIRPYLLETQAFGPPVGRLDDEEGDSEPDDDELDPWGLSPPLGFIQTRFNITEDMNIDLDGNGGIPGSITPVVPNSDEEALKILCQPLPADLTTCHKDLLILMAAYNGDIDRYHRLRRPRLLDHEIGCIVRGIYHNTLFAQWWKSQPLPEGDESPIRKAISARGIMNNDLSYILSPNGACPRLIWYPAVAASSTYEALARLIPPMRPNVARAAIFSNNQTLFDSLIAGDDGGEPVEPSFGLLNEARRSHNVYYREALEQLPSPPPGIGTNKGEPDSIYNGMSCNASYVETYISIPEEWRRAPEGYQPEDGITLMDLDYERWPPGFSKRHPAKVSN